MKRLLTAIVLLLFASGAMALEKITFTNAKSTEKVPSWGGKVEKSFDSKTVPDSSVKGSMKMTVTTPGSKDLDIQTVFPFNTKIVTGKRYEIRMRLMSPQKLQIPVHAIQDVSPWAKLGDDASDVITTTPNQWQTVGFTFVAKLNYDKTVRAPNMLMGALPKGSVLYVADVVFADPDELPMLARADKTASLNDAPLAVKNGAKTFTVKDDFAVRNLKAKKNWTYAAAWKQKFGEREKISLCGMWDFAPIVSVQDPLPAANSDTWANFIVPGYWRGGTPTNFIHTNDGKTVTEFKGCPVNDIRAAWYKRTIDVPKEWQGKKVLLRFNHFNHNAEILVNGKKVGDSGNFLRFPVMWGDEARECNLDVSSVLKYGENNEIAVRVSSGGNLDEVRTGLSGYVYMETMPVSNFGTPLVTTNVSKKNIVIDFKNSTQKSGELSVTIRDWKTNEAVLEKKVPFAPSVKLDYMPPKLWSPESPNLYWCELKLENGGKTADYARVRFGAKEFTVKGPDYYLNGKKINLFGDTGLDVNNIWTPSWKGGAEFTRKEARAMRALNMNVVYLSGLMPKEVLDVYDEEGIMVLGHIAFGYDTNIKNSDKRILEMVQNQISTLKKMDRFDNHPSHIGFLFDVWFNFHPGVTNPDYTGLKKSSPKHHGFDKNGKQITMTSGDPNVAAGDRAARMVRLNLIAKQLKQSFPDKVLLTGGSGEAGDAYSCHAYHTWGAPFEELRALFQVYGLQRELPIFVGEFNIPYPGAFESLEVWNAWDSHPHSLENFARFYGNDGYRWRPYHTSRVLQAVGPNTLLGDRVDSENGRHYWITSDLYSALLAMTNEMIVGGWRLSGVNGIGFFSFIQSYALITAKVDYVNSKHELPDDLSVPNGYPEGGALGPYVPGFGVFDENPLLKPTLATASYLRVSAPVLAEFADAGQDPYALDHAWFGGEELQKQLVVINESPENRDLTFRVSLCNENNTVVASQNVSCKLAAGERTVIPVKFTVPFTANRVNGRLRAECTNSDKPVTASLDVQWFPEPAPLRTRQPIYLFDPKGGVKEYLTAQKIPFTPVTSLASIPAKPGILIIGREALASANAVPDFNELTRKGMNTLILEQQLASSTELMKTRIRHAVINAAEHPVLAGLQDRDFANWRGCVSVADAYEHAPTGWGWSGNGSRNMVASYVFRRPAHGNYRSLLCSGFDLYQTPLVEYAGKDGSWIASQLELVPRLGKDPVATTLFHRMVSYLDQRGSVTGDVLFFGGSKGSAMISKLAIDCRTVKDLDWKTLKGARILLVSDPDFSKLRDNVMNLTQFVYNGGQIIYIHTGSSFNSMWLPFPLQLKEVKARQALHRVDIPDTFWRCGWDNNDLYWHDECTVPAFTEIPEQANAFDPGVVVDLPHGAGRFTLVSIVPELFKDTPACGKTCRFLSALLTNAGVTIRNNSAAFAAKAGKTVSIDLSGHSWSFALDPKDVGLKEKVETGANGSLTWQTGLIADGCEVKIGIDFEIFLRKEYDGYAWYRVKFNLPPELKKAPKCYLSIGSIDDFDWVYVNGKLVGKTGKETPKWWQAPRMYEVPTNILKAGENTIVVRVFDEKGNGGIATPFVLGNQPVVKGKGTGWQTPYPQGSARDYNNTMDMVRQY